MPGENQVFVCRACKFVTPGLQSGKDWEDKKLGIRSMELMSEKVMPAVNAAISQSEAAE